MRYVTLSSDGERHCGLVVDGRILDLTTASRGKVRQPLRKLLRDDELLAEARALAERAQSDPRFAGRFCFPLHESYLLAPIPWPGKVICLGLNYRDHAAETGAEPPSEPVIFLKASSSVIGPEEVIRLPAVSEQVDYEVELAVVIGKTCKGVAASEAMRHVAGYTILNDVSARDFQFGRPGGQWALGKSFDTFCPLGPWIVSADEIPDPCDLRIECLLGGEVVQSSSTSEMIFGVEAVIEHVSAAMTLECGDVLGMGTPAGVGQARTPPRYLRSGDVVECRIEGIGSLVNTVE
jgi:2-keto-4-pentenoate hydratase/2-oxohepta-3-ene-1,7-dioic acid hydratase in catechol pathway